MRRKIEKEQIKLVTWQSKSSETETVNSNWKSSASQTGVSGWTLAKRSKYFEHSKTDCATINAQTIKEFDEKWNQIETRMEIVPGKEVLKRVREICQTEFAVNLTETRIIDEINKNEIPSNLIELIEKLEAYRKLVSPEDP